MTYHLKREVVDGVINIFLGMPEVDAYLQFVRDRCRLNTMLSYGYDLQVFLTGVPQPNFLPEGIISEDYYRVTGARQGKISYGDGQAVNLEEASFTVSEIEQKIASMRESAWYLLKIRSAFSTIKWAYVYPHSIQG